jgi:hypothetical protein
MLCMYVCMYVCTEYIPTYTTVVAEGMKRSLAVGQPPDVVKTRLDIQFGVDAVLL